MPITRRDVGVTGAGIIALTASVVVTAVVLLVFAPVSPRQALHDWLEFVPLPGLVVFAASCSGVFKRRPWLLLLVGPLAFVIAALGLVMTHGILFAPAILARKPAAPADEPAWPDDSVFHPGVVQAFRPAFEPVFSATVHVAPASPSTP
jgi:hypothetical protein